MMKKCKICNEECEIIKRVDLKGNKCLIKGGKHNDMSNSMYVEISRGIMSMKCDHPECCGKIYGDKIKLTKDEIKIVFWDEKYYQ